MQKKTDICLYFFSLLILAFAVNIYAAITPAELAADFSYRETKISPDGKHLAITIVQDGKRQLAVVNSKTFASVGGVNFGSNQEVGEFYWVSNKRLVIKVLVRKGWQEEPQYHGELFAVDFDGKRKSLIYGHRAGEQQVGSRIKKRESVYGWAEIISLLPDDEDHILISTTPMSLGVDRVPSVYRIDVKNGRKLRKIAHGPAPYSRFFTDQKGNLKLAVGIDEQNRKQVFRYIDKDWKKLENNEFGTGFTPLSFDSSAENLFVLDNLNQDIKGLFSLDLNTGKRKEIYTDKNVDAEFDSVLFNSTSDSAYALRIEDGYPTYSVFNSGSEEATVFKELLASLPGYRLSITSSSEDGMLWLISAENDISAGTYLLYDRKKNTFKSLFTNFASLNKDALSESIPIQFKASDEQVIHGYITYPISVPETQNVPLVTLVHGGPHARDTWSFNREAQLLASRGYAVLQLNFRGSKGYGNKIHYASEKQWGGRVQKDIIEGTQWAIAQGGILKNNVCIMGGSFGGYSAMQSAILAPDLFKCVVANAGVYDLEMMFEEGDIPDRLFGKSYLTDELGTDKAQMRAYSPVYNLEKLKASVLIAHGKKDRRVPIEQAEALRKGLDRLNKPYEWFVKSNETHGFYGQENRAEYFEKVVEFLEKHLN